MPSPARTFGPAAQHRAKVLINAAHGLTHYSLLILPTAVLTMASPAGGFGTDYGPILKLATGGFILYGLFSLPQGWLAARLGRHALMAIFFLGTGACLVARRPAADALGAGRRPGRRRTVRRHLPPGRHRHAGRPRRRPARPGARAERRVRQYRRRHRADDHRSPGRRVRLALGLRRPRAGLRRRRPAVAADRPPSTATGAPRAGRSRRSRATWCAAPSSCCC